MVFADGIDRGEDNGRQRSTHRQVGQHRSVEALHGETQYQHRHDDDAAANAEQPGQHACAGAQQQIEHEFHCRPRKFSPAW
ncbi:hypothetical protein D3C76_1415330 [compost metagenome]